MKHILLKRTLHDLTSGQSGAAAVFVALALVVLLGFSAFVLDMGVAYTEASRLQNALDSAVLAGAKELPAANTGSAEWAAAVNEAVVYASLNKYPITEEDISPVYKNDDPASSIVGIKVQKSVEVEYNFARVLGINSGTVSRTASAGVVPAGSVRGAVPLSITAVSLKNAIDSGHVSGLTIKSSTNGCEIGIDTASMSGWFGALRLNGCGASDYSALLATGYNETLSVGQTLDIESGNMSGPTLEGFSARYDACVNGCTAESYEPGCPRLVYVPVVEVLSNDQVRVVSFAAFFLDEIGGTGKNSYIKATYINGTVLPDAASGKGGQDFGLYISKLLG